MAQLTAASLQLAYDHRVVVEDLDLTLPEGKVTMIVGANGSGKSTLLRGLSRLLPPQRGQVRLDGTDIHSLRGKELARRLGLLPQAPLAPDGVTVRELVTRGRYPHQGLFPQWTDQDEQAVAEALALTRTDELSGRMLDELSGGQRQRVWIAMALAQRTDVLLLDEPTTYLDVTHQLEVLDVVRELNRTRGTTVGIVLHDLQLAARYADHLVAVRGGAIHSQGAPADVITADMVREVFALEALIAPDPVTGTPMVLPLGREGASPRVPEEDPMTPAAAALESTAAPRADLASTAVPALEASPQLAFPLTVAARHMVGANLLRLTLTGPDLHHLGVGGPLLDVRIKLIIPAPDAREDHLAALRPDALAEPAAFEGWYRGWLQVDPAERGWMRTYSIREWRGAGHPGNLGPHPELDIDMVLHLEEPAVPGSGVAARWAAAAQVGDPITLLGPNARLVGPDYGGIEFRPGTARRVLLAGDETALPAICAVLETLPESFTGHALIEVPDAADAQRILTRSDVEVSWLPRGDAPHGTLLDPAVRTLLDERPELCAECSVGVPHEPGDFEEVDIDSTILWETTEGHGPFYAWLAGEAGVITGLRRHLVKELGVDRKQVSFMGYWRKGRAEG
ncbi:SIP domain-containing protein [Brachybacterium aquaticum]|uniref:Mycobactin import ATP-binding/permease protein IrtA n=1 Tax=Brachybacterium aquaticum TaxID=1432564 RepID=A0A841A8W0_9MICO|nr:SIP domain-containing protein [Brachybacterium aquaticum]MBB5830373.1 iron complex transport system ATP-binding protein [Brachybacterium aquaticum]